MHLSYALLDNALHRPAPSRVKNADSVALRVDQNHRQAVRGLNRKQQMWSCRYQAVPGQRLSGNRVNTTNDVGMNLPHSHERPE
jgi:hypothetical protein